jgi:hypothetical protein
MTESSVVASIDSMHSARRTTHCPNAVSAQVSNRDSTVPRTQLRVEWLLWTCIVWGAAACSRPAPLRTTPSRSIATVGDAMIADATTRVTQRPTGTTSFNRCMLRRLLPADGGIFNSTVWPNFMSSRLRPRTRRDWLPAPCELVDPSTCPPTPRFEDDPIGAVAHCAASTMQCNQQLITEFDRVRALGGMRDIWIEPAVTCECGTGAAVAIDDQIRKTLTALQACVHSTLMPTQHTDPILFYVGEFRSDHLGRLVEFFLRQDDAATVAQEWQFENAGSAVSIPNCLQVLLAAQAWPLHCNWAVYFRTRDIERIPAIHIPGDPPWSR